VAREAHGNGLSCVAITDHDTLDGIQPTVEAAKEYGIEVITGIELSSEVHEKDVHILGYLFDCTNQQLTGRLRQMQDGRIKRMDEMIVKLKGLGVDNITLDEVCRLAKSDSVGRPHLASVLLEKGWVSSIQMAFNKYLAEGAPAYVSKFQQTPREAIALIKQAGGIAVLAHPMLTQIDELIPGLVEAGLGGIEAHYPNASTAVIRFYEGLARKHRLVVTGGSDAHGHVKKHTFIGKLTIPYELVEKLKQACRT
jgi:predicted metal-dependent phosphoesterase TrpH